MVFCGGLSVLQEKARKFCFADSLPDTEFERVVSDPHVQGDGVLTFRQAVAVVRHGERLDSTLAWASHPDRVSWPLDPPLTAGGLDMSRDVGFHLEKNVPEGAAPFEVVVSSPFLRCAETASEIARVLEIPVVFDRDVGEIFGEAFRDVQDRPHRSPGELAAILQRDFPDVKYAIDADGGLQVLGNGPSFPETLKQARKRFQFKAQNIARAAGAQLKSIILVTHADAVAAIASLMKMSLCFDDVPPCACFIAARSVGVVKKSSRSRLKEKTIYGACAPRWGLTLSDDIKYRVTADMVEKRRADLRTMLVDKVLTKQLYRNDFVHDTADCDVLPVTHSSEIYNLINRVVSESEFTDCSATNAHCDRHVFMSH